MKHLAIQNFKFGLDSRRDVLTSQPGTLLTLENAVINQGGEVEKRKSFVVFADVSVTYSLGGFTRQATFGLQELSDRLVVFGSAYESGSHGDTRPVITAPTGVTYKQLVHPAVTYGVPYDDTKHRMTAIVASAQFADKTWAVATYADTNTFVFYDTDVVLQFLNGRVLTSLTTNLFLAQQLAQQLSTLTGWQIELSSEHVNIKSPTSTTFSESITEDSTAGALLATNIGGAQVSQTTGVGATAQFTIASSVPGSETGTILLSAVDSVGATLALYAAPVQWNTDANTTATAIRAAVNAVASTGYTASGSTNEVIITAPIAYGDLTADLTVVTSSATLLVNATAALPLAAVLSGSGTKFVIGLSGPSKTVYTDDITCNASEGTAPYSYVWACDTGITVVVPNPATAPQIARCHALVADGDTVVGRVRCTVTDSSIGPTVVITAWLTVSLSYTSYTYM